MMFSVAGGLIFILVLLLLFQNFRMKSTLNQMETLLLSESDRGRSERETLNLHMQQTLAAANDLRRILGLPVVLLENPEEPETEEPETDPELAELEKIDVFYSAVDLLEKTEQQYRLSDRFMDYMKQQGLFESIRDLGAGIRQTGSVAADISAKGQTLFALRWDGEDRFLVTEDGTEESLTTEKLLERVKSDLISLKNLEERTATLRRFLRNDLPKDGEVTELIEERSLRIQWGNGSDTELILLKADYEEAGRVAIDSSAGAIVMGDKSYQKVDPALTGFKEYLKSLEHRTEVEIKDSQAVALIEAASKDPAFREYLETNGYVLAEEPREVLHGDYRYWDITREGELIGSFALLIGFGELYLLDNDGLPIQSFRGFTEDHRIIGGSQYEYTEDFQVLTDIYSSKSSSTYLCIGTHEKNADTMILAHADLETNQTLLISIPRDLWFKDRKINSVYRYYGPEALVREISELTGLKIDGYVSVDMYAFIDIIDIMGGVDIVLEEPLVDPNHKIKENGQWTTLNYPAGPLHLDGVGALRVVRSRHTSNDFERAKRQQKVISAMKDRALDMALHNLDTLSKFISAAVQYTDTDLGPGEMLRLFLKYKNTDINMGNVIDNTNILYTSYSNLYKLTEEEQNEILEADLERVRNGEEAQFNKGAWIVLPKNNDWNLIKWYIREMINPES